MKIYNISFVFLVAIFLASCVNKPDSPSFESSKSLPSYTQESFEEYVKDTKKWIANNRVFITKEHEKEIELNSPYELKPITNGKIKKGILLVHGLGDSPAYFKDIANELRNKGWLVRVILTPGHGTKPADLILAKYKDWKNNVAHHVKLLSKKVDEVWLGGFSTGGNLVTSYALDNEDISGLFLFSPGFYTKSKLLVFSPYVKYFIDWVNIDEENDVFRYESLSTNGSILYYKSMKELQNKLENKTYDKPVLITFSQDDSVLNSYKTLEVFSSRFTNKNSRFIWYGKNLETKDSRVKVLNSSLPNKKISTFSHMNVMFSAQNKYYGENGTHIKYDNGQKDISIPKDRLKLWYSAWGYKEDGKYHARLTWNPYFSNLIEDMENVSN